MPDPLRTVILTSNARGNAARVCDYLLSAVPEAEIVGAIVDVGSGHDRARQWRRLRAWLRQGGPSYAAWRLWLNLEPRVRKVPPAARYHLSLEELGARHGFAVTGVPSVNDDAALDALQRLSPDLALSLGNRIIQRRIFSAPRLGTVNLHHGGIPDYRGGPPAFWELHDGAPTMGVSVHRVDDKLDHGDLLARGEVEVRDGDDPAGLMLRARSIDYALVGETVRALAAGTAQPIAVEFDGSTVRTIPDRAAIRRVSRRVGRPVRPDDFRRAPLEDPLPARGG